MTAYKTHLECLHSFHVFFGSLGSGLIRIIEFAAVEVSDTRSAWHDASPTAQNALSSLIAITSPTSLLYLSDKPRLEFAATYSFHHRKVFKVVVCLEKRVAGVEFD